MTATKSLLIVLLVAGLALGTPSFGQIADAQQQSLQQAIDAKRWDLLPEFNDPHAVEVLIRNICEDTPYQWVTSSDIYRLGSIAVVPLLAQLHNPKPNIRLKVLDALTLTFTADDNGLNHSDPRLVNALVDATGDTEVDVRVMAYYFIRSVGSEPSGRLEQAVISGMNSKENGIQSAAVNAAPSFRTPAIRDALIRILQTSNSNLKARAAGLLSIYTNDEKVVPVLIAALHDPAARSEAALGLGSIGDPRAIEPLVALLTTRTNMPLTDYEQYYVARSLARIGTPALEPLRAAWTHADKNTKPAIACALAMIPDQRATQLLFDYVYHASKTQRELVLDTLATRDDPEVLPLISRLANCRSRDIALEALWKLSLQVPGRTELLLSLLKHPDPARRTNAMECLWDTPAPVDQLLACLKDRDAGVRNAAAHSLQFCIPDPRIADALVPLLRNKRTRFNAAIALANQHDNRGADVLLAAMNSLKTREDAARAFRNIDDSRAVPVLICFLDDKDTNLLVAALSALKMQHDPRIVPSILAHLKSVDFMQKLFYTEALSALAGPAEVNPLIALSQDSEDADIDIIETLGNLKDPRAIPTILKAMDIPWVCREKAIPAMVAMGNAAYEPAIKLLTDGRPWVREAGAVILGKLGNPQAVPVLKTALSDPDPETRAAVVEALGRLHIPNGAELLTPLLTDTAAVVRKAAAHAVSLVGEPSDIPALRELLTDPSMGVRYAAAGALARFGDEQGMTFLLDAAKNENYANRRRAIAVLAEVKDPRAFDALVNLINDATEHQVRDKVIDALAQRGDARAIGPLMNALHRNPNQSGAVEALQKLTGLPYDACWYWEDWWYRQQQQ